MEKSYANRAVNYLDTLNKIFILIFELIIETNKHEL